jgi:hypothetical protein
VKLLSVEHGMLVPQGYDLKALERIGHLGAVFSLLNFSMFLQLLMRETTAPYMRDKIKRLFKKQGEHDTIAFVV